MQLTYMLSYDKCWRSSDVMWQKMSTAVDRWQYIYYLVDI